MRISRRNQSGKAGAVGQTRSTGGSSKSGKANAASGAQRGPGEVDVTISPKAAEVEQAKAVVEGLPETRVELVSAIQGEVEGGTYARDSQKIAKRMVNEALRESLRRKGRR
ncbi:flagellar biosynthesis anti-sigma factor FlgM [Candidatus Sumerlaeota bacterium]|nr:flagellar biosynthesis anti-sigma factor FlgM [Candidatus Sumerlaeota bacterium]